MGRQHKNRKPPRQHCRSPHGEVKVIFPTELDAKIEIAGHAKFDTASRYYKCRFRNHYHITTQAERVTNERDEDGKRDRR